MTDSNGMLALLRAEFDAHEVRHFEGRGGKTYDYIEDETVMSRLDDVFGLGAWEVFVTPVGPTCVKVTLQVSLGDAVPSRYEDFGYSNNADSAEPLKEAVSDGIRRCGRYLGIGRYLYLKHDSPARTESPPRPVSRPSAAVGSPAAAADEPPFPGFEGSAVSEGRCRVHDKPWRTNSRGYYCATKVGDDWCKEQPSKAYQARQEVAS